MSDAVFVSFFTCNWRYPQMAQRLASTLQDMGVAYDIRCMPSDSDWLANTRIKPRFIRQMLKLYPRIVWIDADSDVHQLPRMLLNFREDLLLRPHSTVPGRAWHVSVMGWRSTPETVALCDAWLAYSDEHGGTDEAAFDAVISEFAPALRIGLMPAKYHRIPGEAHDNAVITIGISKDEDKMRIKNTEGFR
ncbi:hypothetical protein DEO48_08400 [Enterobacter sp. CGMCC 5087]|uniref:hypothetical protein n=1 Tax=Enterobacter sp. CGMCC 5087 TaxID=2183878 RepID=UPI000D681B50|nr:hypothetical protein [Enterobacter sp. CGMCC 5087]PWI80504.1 hypothetical protein DEO48_08400 [Enterobacter sp. CGMCC 5087]